MVVFVALMACYAATYPVLKPATFLLPSIVLFFATRSFGSYLVMLIPAAVAAAATTQRPQLPLLAALEMGGVRRGGGLRLAVLAALTSPSPLAMAIESVRTTGQLATVDQLTVSVTNNSARSVRPSFTVEEGMTMTAFWRRVHGPPLLGAHQKRQVHASRPRVTSRCLRSPTASRSWPSPHPAHGQPDRRYVANVWRVVLRPSAINQPVARGKTITVRAEIVNRLDQPVRAANVPVYLGQVIYAQSGTHDQPGLHQQGFRRRRLRSRR